MKTSNTLRCPIHAVSSHEWGIRKALRFIAF
jgi:hypothetical protein